MRQLAQRITARYHLLPLTEQETFEYVNHRLQSVGATRPLFDKKSMKLLFKLSKGTPRLINLLADRALMGAFANNARFVNNKVVKLAAQEVLFDHPFANESDNVQLLKWSVGLFAFMGFAYFAWSFFS